MVFASFSSDVFCPGVWVPRYVVMFCFSMSGLWSGVGVGVCCGVVVGVGVGCGFDVGVGVGSGVEVAVGVGVGAGVGVGIGFGVGSGSYAV